MKRVASGAAILAPFLLAAAASAEDTEPPPPLPPPTPPLVTRPEPPPSSAPPSSPPPASPAAKALQPEAGHEAPRPQPRAAPPARTGFQLALRTGVAVPMGKVASGAPMYGTFSPQVPLIVDIGAKPVPNLFVGAYLGLAVGGVNGALAEQCARTNAECASASFWLGLEAHYHFAPARKLNPWIGYGLGFEGAGVGNTSRGRTTTTTFSGFNFARLSGGFDVRVSRVIGLGPMLDLSFSRYSHTKVKVDDGIVTDSDIDDKRVHAWLTLGGRLVFFP